MDLCSDLSLPLLTLRRILLWEYYTPPILVLFSQVKSHRCYSLPFAKVHRGFLLTDGSPPCSFSLFNFTNMDYFRCYAFYILKQEAELLHNEKL